MKNRFREPKAIIGLVYSPDHGDNSQKQYRVIGFEMDTQAYYQFYSLDCNRHFRKFVEGWDKVTEIPYSLACEIVEYKPKEDMQRLTQ